MATAFNAPQSAAANKVTLNGTATSTSPCVITMPAIPAYGVYLATVTAWHGHSGDRAIAAYLVTYYKNPNANAMLSAQLVGSPVFPTSQLMTGMTLGAPNSSGVMAVTITTTRGNSQGKAQVELIELSSVADQYAAN